MTWNPRNCPECRGTGYSFDHTDRLVPCVTCTRKRGEDHKRRDAVSQPPREEDDIVVAGRWTVSPCTLPPPPTLGFTESLVEVDTRVEVWKQPMSLGVLCVRPWDPWLEPALLEVIREERLPGILVLLVPWHTEVGSRVDLARNDTPISEGIQRGYPPLLHQPVSLWERRPDTGLRTRGLWEWLQTLLGYLELVMTRVLVIDSSLSMLRRELAAHFQAPEGRLFGLMEPPTPEASHDLEIYYKYVRGQQEPFIRRAEGIVDRVTSMLNRARLYRSRRVKPWKHRGRRIR